MTDWERGGTTPTEKKLANLWMSLLGVDEVKGDDHFFELGGQSLIAARLVSRIWEQWDVELSVRSVFEHGTLSSLAALIDSLARSSSIEKRIPFADRARSLPLSFAQESLWFVQVLEPSSRAYYLSSILRLKRAVSPAVLAQAFDQVQRRHESLRTTFHARQDGAPEQRIHPLPLAKLQIWDLGHAPETERRERALALCEEERQRPYALDEGPLVRSSLLILSEDEQWVLTAMHHIVSDGWSGVVLAREMTELAAAIAEVRPPQLLPLPIQYADFAAWERHQAVDEQRLKLAYWQDQLRGAPPLLELPTDSPRGPRVSDRARSLHFRVPATMADQLRRVAQHEGASLFMGLMAAFKALLHRHSGMTDLVVGTDVANRRRAELEPLIGYFINQLALRTSVHPGDSLRALIQREKACALAAYEHQEVPFEEVVRALNPERSLSHEPVFQVGLTLQNLPALPESSGWETLEALPVLATKLEWQLYVTEQPDGLACEFQYRSALWDEETIRRVIDQFTRCLACLATRPDTVVKDIPWLGPEELSALLALSNGPAPAKTSGPSLLFHQQFEEQARRTPDRLALFDDDTPWTYAALNDRATRWAMQLRRQGVGPESVVALHLPRSANLIAGMLAVLKAGGAYLPLDVGFPEQRLALLLRDSGARWRITHAPGKSQLGLAGVHIWDVASLDGESVSDRPEGDGSGAQVVAQSAAYVLYTSGSTGRPKPVVVSHGMLARFALSTAEAYGITSTDRVLQFASPSWDTSVEEIFPVLVQGGTLVLRKEGEIDPSALMAHCRQALISVINIPTSYWHELVGALSRGEAHWAPSLRTVIIGGEAARSAEAIRWRSLAPNVRTLNTYGLTEVTALASVGELPPVEWIEQRRTVPLGRPFLDVQTYILDSALNLAPRGVPGELYIGGAGVARGYWNDSALTAERFIPNPFSRDPGARLYRTGDIVRWLSNDTLEYRGRSDRQVKVRGIRVETGEVEDSLRQRPGVANVVVELADLGSEKRLVAYVARSSDADGAALSSAGLRASLKGMLLEAMIPAAVVLLDKLPLLPNGKVDHRALPRVELPQSHGWVAPQTDTQRRLSAIWSEVLARPQVGIEDNFFELGGHSLLATRVVARARAEFEVELSVRALFENATVAGLAKEIEVRKGTVATDDIRIVASGGLGLAPMSYAQERLFFLHQLQPESRAFHINTLLRLNGPVDLPALQRAFLRLQERHQSLRTTFEQGEGGTGISRIHAAPLAEVTHAVALGRIPQEREANAKALCMEEANRPYDLERGPLVRLKVVRLTDREHFLLTAIHHIVADGWSLGLLSDEMTALYAQESGERENESLPALPIQYADYASWERSALPSARLQRQANYWRHQLADAPEHLDLPTDVVRPLRQSDEGGVIRWQLSPAQREAIRTLARTEGASHFMVLMAAFKVLLWRYTGVEDLVVGTDVSNRSRLDTERLIGFFVNQIALRSRVTGTQTFRDRLRVEKETALQAFAHQEFPFENLVKLLNPSRSLAHQPVFQVKLSFENKRPARFAPGVTPEPFGNPPAPHDWQLDFEETEAGLRGEFRFRKDLFSETFIQQVLAHFLTILDAALAEPERALSDSPLLSEEEKRLQLVTWNHTPTLTGPRRGLIPLFQAQLAKSPGAVALTFQKKSLTFAEVDAKTSLLADVLRGRGVRPEVRVGVLAERGFEPVLGFLAVLKAGGVYVPLDPALPQQRLDHVLRDATPVVVLTQSNLQSRVSPVPVVLFEQPGADEPSRTALGSGSAVRPETAAAYIIYTSGSTGTPKGVVGTIGGLENRLRWMFEAEPFQDEEVCCQKTSLSFVDAIAEMLTPLLGGIRTVIADNDQAQTPAKLLALLAEARVTRLLLVPSLLQALLEHDPALGQKVPKLQKWIVSGEALGNALVRQFYAALPGRELLNLYGSSEVSADVTFHRVMSMKGRAAPIGRPLANNAVYVLDAGGQLVPRGAPGELYVGGVGLARGYWGMPALTAEKFVPNPFGESGSRLYRTGDLARWLPEGELEFLGRADAQVKVRGVRVELGEVESVLQGHPEVEQAVVSFQEDVRGDKRLVAYVVRRAAARRLEQADVRADIEKYLSMRLSEAMLPAALVFLTALPRTATGKVDRRALPKPDWDSGEPYVAPVSDLEKQLSDVVRTILGVERVGLNDNFFRLGGHSLLVMRMASLLRERLGVELGLKQFFETPTLGGLSLAVENAQKTQRPPLLPRSRPALLPLSYAQERLWFLTELRPDSTAYHITWVMPWPAPVNVSALETSVQQLVERHETLRTSFLKVDGKAVQSIQDKRVVPLVVMDLRHLPAEEARRQAKAEVRSVADRPYDLGQGPLLRATLVQETDDKAWLVLGMHHLISDGWSLAIIDRDLKAFYRAKTLGEPAALPALPVQYADYVLWQREWMQGASQSQEIAYWETALGGAPDLVTLPPLNPRPPIQSSEGNAVRLSLPLSLRESLRLLGESEGATFFMTVLSAFNALITRYGAGEDVVVGTPVANRTQREEEGLVGFFVNTLVLRTQTSGRPSFRQLIQRVKATALDAYQHQQVPFESVVEALNPVRSLSHAPLFQMMFLMESDEGEAADLNDIRTAKFDLTVVVQSGEGRWGIEAQYASALYSREMIDAFLGHFKTLLEAMVAAPSKSFVDVPLLSSSERQTLIETWGGISGSRRGGQTMTALFESQALRSPTAPALITSDATLSYGSLNGMANRLAHALIARGVGPEERVALCLERSAWMVATELAVWKAGGAFVPLDPTHPPERFKETLQSSGARWLVTHSALRGRGPEPQGMEVVFVDSLELETHPQDNPPLRNDGGHLAYIIYTSGSTGRPKGVQIEHRGIVNTLAGVAPLLGLDARSRMLAFANYVWDGSLHEFYLPLAVGGALVLIQDGERELVGEGLAQFIDRLGVNAVQLTPTVLATMRPETLPALKTVAVGGEACPPELVARWSTDGRRFVNLYGPTEASICATGQRCDVAHIGIGTPLPGTTACVLDSHHQLVPIGAPGELYVGGLGLARGYVKDAAQTAERFIPSPLGPPGERLYRTGDLVRWMPHGQLEYLGRVDTQIKLRGLRIELGEVESTLEGHPDVSQAAAALRTDMPGASQLVAYVVGMSGRPRPTPEGLRDFMAKRVPSYIVPSTFMVLEALPMLPNGKVNRKALPKPEVISSGTFESPRTPSEKIMAGLWAELLALDRVGRDDNFFELGGNSLLGITLLAKVEKETGKRLALTNLFHAPVLSRFAELLGDSTEAPAALPMVNLGAAGPLQPFFCVTGVGGNLFELQAVGTHLKTLGRPMYGLEPPPSPDGIRPAFPSTEALAGFYISQIKQVQPRGPYLLGGYSFGGTVAYEMAQQLQSENDNVSLLALIGPGYPKKVSTDSPERPMEKPRGIRRLQAWWNILLLIYEAIVGISKALFHTYIRGRKNLRRVLKAQHQALERYVHQPYAGPVTLFLHKLVWGLDWDVLKARYKEIARGGLKVVEVPGNHDTFIRNPHAARLAEALQASMEEVDPVRQDKAS